MFIFLSMKKLFAAVVLTICSLSVIAQPATPLKIIAFYTAKNDQAHISFVHEANAWFKQQENRYQFSYDTTSNWDHLNREFLSGYQVVIFLDTRPETPAQRRAF